jgi:hypothetical protein
MDAPAKEWTTDDWNTPQPVIDAARAALGGTILLDPFSNEWSSVGAVVETNRSGFDDWDELVCYVLSTSLPERRTALVNGPWSLNRKVVHHCIAMWMKGWEIVQVTPTSLNASYWHLIDEAPAVCYPAKRWQFLKEGKPARMIDRETGKERPASNRQDAVAVLHGSDPWRFRQAFRELGRVRFG